MERQEAVLVVEQRALGMPTKAVQADTAANTVNATKNNFISKKNDASNSKEHSLSMQTMRGGGSSGCDAEGNEVTHRARCDVGGWHHLAPKTSSRPSFVRLLVRSLSICYEEFGEWRFE
jgi:hypothetical protein